MVYVIGFCGCARVGKTSCAEIAENYISQEIDPDGIIVRRSFAQPLKEGLALMGVEKERDHDFYRDTAQYVGTNILRKKNNNWWVDLMEESIGNIKHKNGQNVYVLIDDVRFPNEAELIKNYDNGRLIFIYGGDRIDLSRSMYEHDSEKMGVYYENALRGNPLESNFAEYTGVDGIISNHEEENRLHQKVRDVVIHQLERLEQINQKE